MDVSEALRTALRHARHLLDGEYLDAGEVLEMAQAITDLDGCIRNGGLLPIDWN